MDSLVPGALRWVGGGWQRSLVLTVYLWLYKSYKHWTEISRKRTSRPKIYTANPFPEFKVDNTQFEDTEQRWRVWYILTTFAYNGRAMPV